MAIQMRRGAYGNFDDSKLLPGEWAVVQSGDSSSDSGQAVYICFSPGTVKRIATLDEVEAHGVKLVQTVVDGDLRLSLA